MAFCHALNGLKEMPTVSVVIPCFNASAWIREALKSVFEQEIPDLELIVVDDGSTDGSFNIVQKEFPSVHLVRVDHSGPSHARNVGTKASVGKFIQYLDADDMLGPDKLKIQLQALGQSGADIAYGDWQKLIHQADHSCEKGEIVRHLLEEPSESALLADFWCPPSVYLFRREVVEKSGGWDPERKLIEDVWFMLRCAQDTERFVYCPGIMAYYRIHPGSASTRDPEAFVLACLKNALGIEDLWEKQGGINEDRRKALLKAYGYVARASFAKDLPTFETAYSALNKLKPGYVPEYPRHLAAASKILGYKNAERLAFWYRKMRGLLGQTQSQGAR